MDEINSALARERQADLLRRAQQRRDSQTASNAQARFGLSRELWFVVLGIFLNYVGYGAVLPFEIIYLHDGRGFSLGVAGLVVGLITGVAVVTVPIAGPLIDRFGARTVGVGAGVALAAGYVGLAFAYVPAHAFVAAAIAGAGNGALNPSQSTLIATLAPSHLRHRATAISRVAGNVGIGIGGGVGGLVAAYGVTGFVLLFLANGLTYLIYVCVLVAVVRDDTRPEPVAGGYRLVVRDRAFVQLAVTNTAMIAVGWGVFTWLVPPFAGGDLGLSAQLIGLLLLANAATVAVAQLPIARLAEGRRRVVMMALAAWLFVGAYLLVLAAGASPGAVYPALFAAAIAVAIGECFHTAVLMPLTADLAPAGLRGRYMASMGLSWWLGLTIAPVLGIQLLSASPTAAFLTAALVALGAGASALMMERALPESSRLTPRPSPESERRTS
ncbi:MFS transporter [Acrocarpospora pleiomorpha]|uniref:MFS transporter n=1 Tax=Acrocarpospora pleiomorpha TaxID=90975 RepID=A0A5M3XE97_9ACTN|nr:MFS transporter [Acrocarpospora pleiomorpha]GES19947.1 MFS transporter [Acrocarpospora pleiomorpha]